MDEYGEVLLQEGQHYWLFHSDDSYSAVKLIKLEGEECTVEDYESKEHSLVDAGVLVGMIPAPSEITLATIYDDLTEAVDISEASILWNMRKKYEDFKIYSSIGPILIAVNPYQYIDALYNEKTFQFYVDGYKGKYPPHIWAIAKASFEQLKNNKHRQAIIISGESGAGKTETTKKCLQYLSAVSMKQQQHASETETPVEEKVLGSNPILESFGNAKTCRNNNSSRFGKWLEINFVCRGGKFNLIGANITQYLLEKSRVVMQAEDERNYHIFYQMCSDESTELGPAANFAFLNQSGCTDIDGVDDCEEFQNTNYAFSALKFPPEDVTAIQNALKAILFLGNINFEENGEGSQVTESTNANLKLAAHLLGLDESDLSAALINRSLSVRGEVMEVPLDPSQAVDTRNALSKEIYGRLFAQIVRYANKSLSFQGTDTKNSEKIISIGLLDIFGFEIFTSNSFEQLCINYGNEKLQQYFINYVLKKEQQTYEAEGIEVDKIETIDNEDILQLLEMKGTGLFSLLDEELRLPRGSDSGFLKKVEKEHKGKTSRFRQDFRMKADNFEISHFAGVVLYDATNFLDKNKDKMYEHLEELIMQSNITEFKNLMEIFNEGNRKADKKQDSPRKAPGSKKQSVTLASRFTGQLQDLVSVLKDSDPHFVRCLKPNNSKSPNVFESQLILQQLRYSGVLEAIQIRKSGYPTRKLHSDFFSSYRVLSGLPMEYLRKLPSERKRCEAILEKIAELDGSLTDIRVGKTMIFYRPEVHNVLENWRMEVGLKAVLCLQASHRRRVDAKRVKMLLAARSSLLSAVDLGREDNNCNVSALSFIYDNIDYCTSVELPCVHIINDAINVAKRLETVKSVLEKLDYCVSDDFSESFGDLALEYFAMNDVLVEADDISLPPENKSYVMVQEKRNEMKSRVDAVLELRRVMPLFDECSLSNCLESFDKLRNEYGDFCETERLEAVDLLGRMNRELKAIDSATKALQESQAFLSSKVKEVEELSMSPDSLTDDLKASMTPILDEVEPMLAPSYSFSCLVTENIIKSFETLLEVRIQWALQDWKAVADAVKALLEVSKTMWPENCNCASEKMKQNTATMMGLISSEASLVSGGIDTHVIVPMLCKGAGDGVASFVDDHNETMKVDTAPLRNALDSVKGFETIGVQSTIFMDFLESVLSFREAIFNDDYECALAHTEPTEVTSFRYSRSSDILKFLNKTSKSQYMELAKSTDGVSYSLFPRQDLATIPESSRLHKLQIKQQTESLPANLCPIVDEIADELRRGRIYALNRYSQSVLLSGLEQWRTTSDSKNITLLLLDDDLTKSIEIIIDEIETLWKKDLISSELDLCLCNSFTSDLLAISKRLVEARQLFNSKEFNKVVELKSEGYFDDCFQLKDHKRTDPRISKILSVVCEELQIIIADSRNEKSEKNLISSFEEGAVTGSIGEINKKGISCEAVEEAMEKAETCVLEDFREYSPLQVLLDISRALVDARRAYTADDPVKQRESLSHLLALKDYFPASINAEVEVMINESDYNDCQKLLSAGLEWPSATHYLTKGRRSSVIVRSKSDFSTESTEIDDDDGEPLVPNSKALDPSRLMEGLEMAEKLKERVGESIFSSHFIDLCTASNVIQSLRQCVLDSQWESGESVLRNAKQSKISERIPSIKEELTEAANVINNAVHILNFERALVEGRPTKSSIDLAILDLSLLSVDQLEKSIDKYQLDTSKSRKAKTLYSAALGIRDLRRSLLGGDWGITEKLLNQLKESRIGIGHHTLICSDEISDVSIAVQNQILIRSIKTALLDVVKGRPGLIEKDSISTTKLSSAIAACSSISSDIKGDFLLCMINLGELVIQGRNAASESEWNVIRDISDEWFDLINRFRASGRSINDNLLSVRPRACTDESLSASTVSSNQFAIKEFEYLANILADEAHCLQNHVTMLLLEADVSAAIQENGVSSKDMVGCIDLSVIRTDGLETVLERKSKLENDTGSSLPENVEKLCKAAQLILDIRREILVDNWSSIPPLLEEAVTGSYHPLPDACRQEIQVIRLECENRWIISMLSNALESGGLEGTVDEHGSLADIQSSTLNESVSFCTTLKPQTEVALSLFFTCQQVLKLRELLQESPIPWKTIKQEAEMILSDESKLYDTGLKEIKLTYRIAENTVVCEMLEKNLQKGGPSGEPGHLDVSGVSAEDLLSACDVAMETSVKSIKANELLNVCRAIASLRKALLPSSSDVEDAQAAEDARSMIKSMVKHLYDTHAKNPSDHGWPFCKAEVDLIAKDAHIKELHSLLQQSVSAATQVYVHRNAASIGSKTISRRKSTASAPPEQLSIDSLDEILQYAEEIEFSSVKLDDLIGCARALRLLRMAMIKDDWEYAFQLAKREDIINPIVNIPFAVSELNYAKQEAHNKITAARLESVLMQDFVPPGSEETDDDFNHSYLAGTIQEAEESDITSISVKQLLECAKNVLILRRGFSKKDSKQVAEALRWFSTNAYRCPQCVQSEAQKAYIMHQNSLLMTGLTAALQEGYATGVVGDINTSSIDTHTLSKLLVQAKGVKFKTPEVKELVEVAEMIHALRCAQRTNDPKGVAKAMSFMSGRNKILPAIVVQEIAFARIAKDNELTHSALKNALTTFDDSISKNLEISLHDSDSKDMSSAGVEEQKSRPLSPAKRMTGKKSRRYSMANMNRADIDLDSIDITSLDEGMEAARTHGLFTNETKQLFRTVSVIKLLRLAMRGNDWPRVAEILQEISDAEATHGKLHELATNEIMTVEKQLEMRTSIVDLSKALKTGWARCSNGIVDIANMEINSLIEAIRRAEKSMQDLGLSEDVIHSSLEHSSNALRGDLLSAITFKDVKFDPTSLSPALNSLQQLCHSSTSSEANAPGKSKMHQQIERLLLSSAVVIDVRKALFESKIQCAGVIAEAALEGKALHEAVLPELTHYATEIGKALNMMRLCEQMRDGMKRGDSNLLRRAIVESKDNKISLIDDLGLLRTLEKAESVLKSILEVEKHLRSVPNIFSTQTLQSILDEAARLNVSGPLVDSAEARMSTLLQFDVGLGDLNIDSGGMVVGKAAQQMICELSSSLNIPHHPLSRRARVLLQLDDSGFSRAMMAKSCEVGNSFSAVTETIRYKQSLLQLPEFQERYELEKFIRLRDPLTFAMRLALQSKEQKNSMLRYSDSPIGTSLTSLSPLLAALSVFVFMHVVKVIDENSSSHPEVLLRNAIIIGRTCPLMRDEILLQCVKQLRSNPSEDSESRIWYLLRACLNHFPPSDEFENFLESFLLSCINARTDTRSHLAHQCIRNLHKAIFFYGYNIKIFSDWDSSLRTMRCWLSPLPPTEAQGSNRILKPLPLSSKCDMYHGTIDPAFDHNSRRLPSSRLRGTRDNWKLRFSQLCESESETNGVPMSVFSSAMFKTPLKMDKVDHAVLMYWLSGNLPSADILPTLRAEVHCASVLYISFDGEEEYRCWERQKLLSNLPISAPRKLNSTEAKGEAFAVFFETVEHCILKDKSLLRIKQGDRRKRSSFVENSDTIIYTDDDEEEPVLTWDMYKDFIIVGMEKILENIES